MVHRCELQFFFFFRFHHVLLLFFLLFQLPIRTSVFHEYRQNALTQIHWKKLCAAVRLLINISVSPRLQHAMQFYVLPGCTRTAVDLLYIVSAQKMNENALGNWMQQKHCYAFVCDRLTMPNAGTGTVQRHSHTHAHSDTLRNLKCDQKKTLESIFTNFLLVHS